jgi:hypothetical protein
MLGLASQRGFCESAQHHAPTPGVPANVEGAGFFDSLGRNAGLSELWEPTPETESVRASLESREIGGARSSSARATAHPAITADRRCCGELTTH